MKKILLDKRWIILYDTVMDGHDFAMSFVIVFTVISNL